MAWTLTDSLDDFLAAAQEHLRAEPVLNTVHLTLLEALRQSGTSVFGDDPPVFGWHQSTSKSVDGAFLRTPPYPVLAASLPDESVEALIELLTADGRTLSAANLTGADEAAFIGAWTRATGSSATGGSASVRQRSRLFRLASLARPDAQPPGAARVATEDDGDLLVDWHAAFGRETGTRDNAARTVADRLSHHGLLLWELAGEPVAMAGLTREVAGVTRVAGVYTLPAHRQRGYGGAITTAISQAALDAGADEVVLFTDQANPTSNALYQRLGYRPVGDRVLLEFHSPVTTALDVTDAPDASS
jgi:RimJ/RimL family protein N-acetyltransferase